MRMWMVDPAVMCRKHLLGEHVEIHMIVGTINKGRSIQGYLDKGLIEPRMIQARHYDLSCEMKEREYQHNSPLLQYDSLSGGPYVDAEKSLKELITRCPECRNRYRQYLITQKRNSIN